MLTLMLTSKGVAGVPRAALVILAGTTFHLPTEGVAVLFGIDALMDMECTSVNEVGTCLASAVVARWEGVRFGKGAYADALSSAVCLLAMIGRRFIIAFRLLNQNGAPRLNRAPDSSTPHSCLQLNPLGQPRVS